ncbi:diguanylate cyclase [Colwellia sp. PAMC 21821]|uniref:GGDEF domain-containing response regulator n=1 Tax=Colwellia sp. PAMC 21821 TaxID=1816219 RepID=UPI0009C009C2|nr:diguanylate cyclase [Colwellia sp. PAMC 21821]ARD42901.1 diguanylate cyclase response regulator [Colwellia sp. PAMC 21821]
MVNSHFVSGHIEGKLKSSFANSDLEKQTLMIVDDYRSNLEALDALFSSQYTVVLQDNAKDAIKYATEQNVDLILLDVDMPVMNGYEACDVLKSNSITADIPIIFVTAAESADEEEKGLLLGAVDYVVKPVNLNILRARVLNHMELVYYRKKLEILSCIDGLTGASNRRQLDIMLQQNCASTTRSGHCLSLLMIDIDDFKLYNDTYGHTQGDQCLKDIAQSIMSVQRRETDVIGRYGGEEFAVVLPETDADGGLVVANEVLNRIRDLNIEHAGSSFHKIVTVSIGLVTFVAEQKNHQEINLEDFVNHADSQLYKAKDNGKNCVCHATVKAAVTQ